MSRDQAHVGSSRQANSGQPSAWAPRPFPGRLFLLRLASLPHALYSPLWDLIPGAGTLGDFINIQDLIETIAQTPSGYPPMLNSTRAFGQTCPLPP